MMATLRSRLLRTGFLIAALALLIGALTGTSGVGRTIDRAIDPLRFALTGREASGKLVVVEMDAHSVAAIRRWPWPRDHYARVVDQLRLAGASAVIFDVDLSSPSTPEGDRAFAAALARSGGIVALPTFRQQARTGETRGIDTMPLPMFREHVTLASVSVAPDPDGAVRQAPWGTITGGVPRPSLAAYTAGRSGAADTFFPINYGIDPASVPRLSFVDIRDGRFDPAAVRGRSVMIGATAIEMGDRYAVPRWGVVPGVVVQAIAAETLMRGTPVDMGCVPALALALLLGSAVMRARRVAAMIAASVAAPLVLFGAAVMLQREQMLVPLAGGLALLMVVIAGQVARQVWQRFEATRVVDEDTGLPNRRALVRGTDAVTLGVVQVNNLDTIVAVLGAAAEADLVKRLAERLALTAENGAVFRVAERSLAFVPVSASDDAMAGLRAVLIQPVELQGRRVDATVTLGLAQGTPETALTQAALAADQAAHDGVFLRWAAADHAGLERRVSLMGELDDALRAGRSGGGGGVEVHYQPKLDLQSGRIVSCEALVRWRHPQRGFIGPDQFIPLAEQTDRIGALTLHVVERAMTDLAAWQRQGHALTVAVNISAKLVASPTFNEEVAGLLAQGIVTPQSLVFEVTESATLDDPNAAGAALEAYRALGVAISMDDYGTGQSSLTYLRELPLSELKIDRSFVQHAHRQRNDALMVRSTVDLAHAMGLKVVAEGVEEEACLDFLRSIGCDMAQGYWISRPVPADAMLPLLADERQIAAA